MTTTTKTTTAKTTAPQRVTKSERERGWRERDRQIETLIVLGWETAWKLGVPLASYNFLHTKYLLALFFSHQATSDLAHIIVFYHASQQQCQHYSGSKETILNKVLNFINNVSFLTGQTQRERERERYFLPWTRQGRLRLVWELLAPLTFYEFLHT